MKIVHIRSVTVGTIFVTSYNSYHHFNCVWSSSFSD